MRDMERWLGLDPSGRYATARTRIDELVAEAADARRVRDGGRRPVLGTARTRFGRWLVGAGTWLVPEAERRGHAVRPAATEAERRRKMLGSGTTESA